MAKHWNTGDKVQLASGGPVMTVRQQSVTANGSSVVACTWFDGVALKEASFSPEMLVEAKH